jgi:hypothetical protein
VVAHESILYSISFITRCPAVRNNILSAMSCKSAGDICMELLRGYGGRSGTGLDTLRRWYLSDFKIMSYGDLAKWDCVVDSAYALNRLTSIKAPLEVYLRALELHRILVGHSTG